MIDNNSEKKVLISKKGLAGIIAITLVVGLIIGTAGLYALQTYTGKTAVISKADLQHYEYMSKKYAKTETLYNELLSKYYKELDETLLMEGIYKGLYDAVGDPYTSYLTSLEYEKLMAATTGDFYGVGLYMSVADDLITVMSTVEGSPAAQAGIKAGDQIIKVDNVAYTGNQVDEAASKMRGKLNTKVTLTYLRNGEEKEVTLTRKKIVTESVYSETLADNIGYIRITGFENATADDFKKELAKMESAGVKGLVIDIRSNGGGIVDSGIEIADMLLKEGTIIYLEDKDGEKSYYNSDAKATPLPYVLLVDKGSASTSEILAAAIKDNKGGPIVGTTTFGKGIVQIVEGVGDGSALRITTKQYFSPSGKVIHEKGVEPDYEVIIEESDIEDKQLKKAIELLK